MTEQPDGCQCPLGHTSYVGTTKLRVRVGIWHSRKYFKVFTKTPNQHLQIHLSEESLKKRTDFGELVKYDDNQGGYLTLTKHFTRRNNALQIRWIISFRDVLEKNGFCWRYLSYGLRRGSQGSAEGSPETSKPPDRVENFSKTTPSWRGFYVRFFTSFEKQGY